MASDDEVEALEAAVGRWPDDERAAASAQGRSRRRWLRQRDAESSTMAGVLLTLTERAAPVTVRCGPWAHVGRLQSVTSVLSVVESADGLVLLPTASVTAVEARWALADDRLPGSGPDLALVLAALAPERPRIRLLLAEGTDVAGRLKDVGKDVAVVVQSAAVVTVRLSALAGCILPGRRSSGPAGMDDPAGQSSESGGALGSIDDFGSG